MAHGFLELSSLSAAPRLPAPPRAHGSREPVSVAMAAEAEGSALRSEARPALPSRPASAVPYQPTARATAPKVKGAAPARRRATSERRAARPATAAMAGAGAAGGGPGAVAPAPKPAPARPVRDISTAEGWSSALAEAKAAAARDLARNPLGELAIPESCGVPRALLPDELLRFAAVEGEGAGGGAICSSGGGASAAPSTPRAEEASAAGGGVPTYVLSARGVGVAAAASTFAFDAQAAVPSGSRARQPSAQPHGLSVALRATASSPARTVSAASATRSGGGSSGAGEREAEGARCRSPRRAHAASEDPPAASPHGAPSARFAFGCDSTIGTAKSGSQTACAGALPGPGSHCADSLQRLEERAVASLAQLSARAAPETDLSHLGLHLDVASRVRAVPTRAAGEDAAAAARAPAPKGGAPVRRPLQPAAAFSRNHGAATLGAAPCARQPAARTPLPRRDAPTVEGELRRPCAAGATLTAAVSRPRPTRGAGSARPPNGARPLGIQPQGAGADGRSWAGGGARACAHLGDRFDALEMRITQVRE